MDLRCKYLPLIRSVNQNFELLKELEQLLDSSECESFGNILLNLTLSTNQTIPTLRHLIGLEFERESEPTSILRGSSLAARLMSLYSRKKGSIYLEKCVGEFVRGISNDPELDLEIDFSKVREESNLKENQDRLIAKINEFVQTIRKPEMMDLIPREIRAIANFIAEQCKSRFFDKQTSFVGGFFLLRVINPCLVAPEAYMIIPEGQKISPKSRRNLTLISKVLQNLSNGTLFGNKEPFMCCMNETVTELKGSMQQFLLSVITDPANLNYQDLMNVQYIEPLPVKLDLRDLAVLHQMLQRHKHKILKTVPNMKKLFEEIGEPPEIPAANELYNAMKKKKNDSIRTILKDPKCTSIIFLNHSDPNWDPIQYCFEDLRKDTSGMFVMEYHILDLLKVLLERGANKKGILIKHKSNPLLKFVRYKWQFKILHLQVLCLMIARSGLNDKNQAGETATHLAAFAEVEESLQFLIKNGADIDCPNARNDTALHYAIQTKSGCARVNNTVQLLLEAGADPSAVGMQKMNCRQLAEVMKKPQIAQIIEAFETRKKTLEMAHKPPQERFAFLARGSYSTLRSMSRKGHDLVPPRRARLASRLRSSYNRYVVQVKTKRSGKTAFDSLTQIMGMLEEVEGMFEQDTQDSVDVMFAKMKVKEILTRLEEEKDTRKHSIDPAEFFKQNEGSLIKLQSIVRRWLAQRKYLVLIEQSKKIEFLQSPEAIKVLETERAYLVSLNLVINGFLDTFRQSPVSLSNEEIMTLFCNITDIRDRHEFLLQELEAYFSPKILQKKNTLGDIFIHIALSLDLYKIYFQHSPVSSSFLFKLRSNFKFELATRELEHRHGIFLENLLEVPVMRSIEYFTLLQDLLFKHLEESSDFEKLHTAMKQISSFTETLKNLKSQSERRKKVSELEKSLTGRSEPLSANTNRYFIHIAPVRRVIEEGNLMIQLLILFNDVLIFTTPEYKYFDEFDVSALFLFDVPDLEGLREGLQVVFLPEYSIRFGTKSAMSFTLIVNPKQETKRSLLDKLTSAASRARAEFKLSTD